MTTPSFDAPELAPGARILMGPGPSEVPPRVLRALATPVIGHLDPEFVAIMDHTQAMLRALFGTANALTLPISGTGSAGMEACLVNVIEPGDSAVIGVNGVFGTRMAEVAARCGATVVRVDAPWGEIVPPERMAEAVARERPRVVALVHAETSTGAWQPVPAIARAARDADALLVLDCVTSLGGVPVEIDAWGVDVAYSGTQKCLSCPPGLSPVTVSERALERVRARRTPVRSWYFDFTLLSQYWGEGDRVYHHTAPISMVYGLYEALRAVFEEGLAARFARHARNHEALVAGLAAMGLGLVTQEGHRLPMLHAVGVPDSVDEAEVRRELLREHGIEIGGGLGPLKGRAWRIGLMGASSQRNYVVLLLAALEAALRRRGIAASGAVEAALDRYRALDAAP